VSRKYKFKDTGKLYFITYAVVKWIDLFIRDDYRNVLLDTWKYCRVEKGLEIYGWCTMTSHVHMIIGSHKDELSAIVRDMKRHTSERLRATIQKHPGESRKEWMLTIMEEEGKNNSNNISFQLWQQHNKPIELLNQKVAWQKLNYIHNNPVSAGFVEQPEYYKYSSAYAYHTGKPPLIEMYFLDPLLSFV
jgi:putative transposase